MLLHKLQESVKLDHTYTGQEIKPCGEALVEVSYKYNIVSLLSLLLPYSSFFRGGGDGFS